MNDQNQVAVIDRAKTMMPEVKKFDSANPFNMQYSQECGFAIMAIQQNPYLLNCTPDSMKAAITSVALTGISLNPALKYAYLVPRKSKKELRCVLDVSYMGMIKILTDAGAVKSVDTAVVCELDHFVYGKGTDPILEHKPDLLKDRGNPFGAYAIAYFRDGGFQFEVMSRPEIEKVRATSESWKNSDTRKFSPWEKWSDEMWKKTVMKRLFKILPKTNFDDQLIAALSKEHDNELADTVDLNGRMESIFEDTSEVIEVDDKPAEPTKTLEEAFDETQVDLKKEVK